MTHNRPNSKAPASLTSWLLVWMLASALMTPMVTPATADEPTVTDKTTGQGAALSRTVNLALGEPVVVAQAPPELNRAAGGWGRWQFPYLRRLADGRLHVSFSVEPDYGQSGGPRHIAVRATTDPAGLDWQSPVHARFSPPAAGAWNSCGHTEMVALDDHTALIVYSDFSYPDENNVQRKTILTGRIQVFVTNP